MKKLFAIALIAVSFAACNSGETASEEINADSLAAQAEALVDTTAVAVDSLAATVDSAVDAAAH